jgi:tetratricopeptide (TPR) repeat protein
MSSAMRCCATIKMPPARNEPCRCGSGRKFKHCCGKPPDAVPAPTAPSDAARAWARGRSLEDQGLLEQAAQSFAQAVALRPEFAEAHNDLGRVLLRMGRTDAAIASCERALALQRRFAAAIGNLANAKRARGELHDAIEGYRRVIAIEPSLAEAHRNLGSALLDAGETQAAIVSLKKAIELRPDFAVALTQLARALSAANRAQEAIPHFERLLAKAPSAELLNEYGTLLVGLRQYLPAARCYRDALARVPTDAGLHANLAHALHCLGDFQGAMQHCRRALELDSRLAQAYLHLGNALLALNLMSEADAAYRQGLAIAPEHAALHCAHAMVERALGQIEPAEASARRSLALRPGAADTLALLGSLAIDHGRFGEAEKFLNQALALDPELPEALTSLTAVRKMSSADAAWRAAAERVLARGLPVAHAINLHHALGKYCDDVDDREAAFEHHRLGNELARRSRFRYDRAEATQRVTRTIAAFDRDSLAALKPGGVAGERPVFVVGMPRSGTSLTEQILASHPQVYGAGELLYWIFAADAERAAARDQRAATIAELGRTYLAGLATRAPDAARVIDKLPVNFANLGLIHAALPGARFIHLQRSPLDTCLSIYFQGFSASLSYATDLGDLAHYYHEYRRLMAHWRAVLPPETLLEMRYEALVEDPEAWSRRMLAHIGMPWDPRCLEFHRTERPVLTASNWQVRQPLGKHSIDRWRRYERFLGPLREALGE